MALVDDEREVKAAVEAFYRSAGVTVSRAELVEAVLNMKRSPAVRLIRAAYGVGVSGAKVICALIVDGREGAEG